MKQCDETSSYLPSRVVLYVPLWLVEGSAQNCLEVCVERVSFHQPKEKSILSWLYFCIGSASPQVFELFWGTLSNATLTPTFNSMSCRHPTQDAMFKILSYLLHIHLFSDYLFAWLSVLEVNKHKDLTLTGKLK